VPRLTGTSEPDSRSTPVHPTPGFGGRFGRRFWTTVSDPAEPWETPVSRLDALWLPGRPFRPTDIGQVPASALAALEAECGRIPLDRLFVVPETTRLIGPRQCVRTPAKVLAFGDAIVGLWIDCQPGRVTAIPIARLMAVDDRQILLYGRLRLIAAEDQLVVRYNTTERPQLRDNLAWLRRQMATTPMPAEPGFLWLTRRGEQTDPERLPFKWRFVLRCSSALADPEEPASVAAGDVAETRGRRSGPASGVAVLGSRELVIASEPGEYLDAARYGFDLLAVPRDRLASLAWNGHALTVRMARPPEDSVSAWVTVPLDGRLVDAMRRSFGSAVAWS
jgi:hypothetical protein